MPAVELSKLRALLQELAEDFSRPADFVRALRAFFERYADRAYRPGETIAQRPLLPSYRLPALVSRNLEMEILRLAAAQPEQALAVIDLLWQETYLEPRLYSVWMLGQLPLRLAESVLERFNAWADQREDRLILAALLDRGTLRLRREGSDALLDLYEGWLAQPEISRQSLGLAALLALAVDPEFENIPAIFRLLFPLVRRAPSVLFNELASLLSALARRTPTETVYFLRQILASPTGVNTARLSRRILPELPPEQQDSLKNALRAHAPNNI